MITAERLRKELPRQIRRTRAALMGDALAEGQSVAAARAQSEAAHKRAYRKWLREFAEENPRLETTARAILRLEGISI